MNKQFCTLCGAGLMATLRMCPACGGKQFSSIPPADVPIPPASKHHSSPIPRTSSTYSQAAALGYGSSLNSNAPDLVLAERGTRLVAAAMDILLFALALTPGILMMSAMESDTTKGVGAALAGIGWLIMVVIQFIMLIKQGQTIGKKVMRIRIVRRVDDAVPGFVQVYVLRTLVPALITAIPYAGFAIFLADSLLIFRDDRRCLHDMIADTKVVKC